MALENAPYAARCSTRLKEKRVLSMTAAGSGTAFIRAVNAKNCPVI